MMLTLDATISYQALRERLQQEFEVPLDRQKIKHGFPPRELHPPGEGESMEEPVPLQHGDRITLEILPDPQTGKVYPPILILTPSNR